MSRLSLRSSLHSQDLGGKSLEEGSEALVLDEVANDGHSSDLGLEVLVLDAGLLEGGGQRRGSVLY